MPASDRIAAYPSHKPSETGVKPGHKVTLVVILALTGLFCAFPNFHPEAILGLSYRWWLDALFHGGYYFTATGLLYVLLGNRRGWKWLWVSLLALSWTLELAQGWIPGRSLSLLDMVSNTVGILMGSLVGSLKFLVGRGGKRAPRRH